MLEGEFSAPISKYEAAVAAVAPKHSPNISTLSSTTLSLRTCPDMSADMSGQGLGGPQEGG